jgi:hypothetical protein
VRVLVLSAFAVFVGGCSSGGAAHPGSAAGGSGSATSAGGAGMGTAGGGAAGSMTGGAGGAGGGTDAAAEAGPGDGGAGAGGAGDGGAGAGGAGGTGAADAATSGGVGGFGYSGASRCATAGTLLCESFESALDANVWTPLVDGDGTAVIDDVHAFRGTKALHVKVVTGHKAAISESKTFPITGNVLYARMFVWFDAFTTTAHFTMAEAPQTAAGAWIRFGGQGGHYGVGTDHGASGDWLQQDTAPVPTKQWTCLEFELKGDTNEFHVWQDDVARTALDVGSKQHQGFVMPPFTSLWFGWQTYSNQAPGEFWIDEIAVDSKPIGCAK